MADVGTPPVIPVQFQPYNSYVTDPQWQRIFTYVWVAAVGLCLLVSLPRIFKAIKRGRGIYAPRNWFGIVEDLGSTYQPLNQTTSPPGKKEGGWLRVFESALSRVGGIFYWTIPGVGLNLGHVFILGGYLAIVIVCIVKDSVLVENSNRAGFLAIAQLPIIFLFATKNSVVSLLLGPGNGYEKLNFIHRWSGRIMLLAVIIHGSLWINNDLKYNLPIMSEDKESSGIRAFAILGVLVLFSLKIVRQFFYEGFFVVHLALFIAFFISICYHTPYATPWIFPPLAFYGLDIFLRMLRYRIKDATLTPIGDQMTLVHVPYATFGWVAGQHVRLRVFFSERIFESHPFTIFTAPPDTTCISSMPQGISFGIRTAGDWTRALNQYAKQTMATLEGLEQASKTIEPQDKPKHSHIDVPIQVMLDGPYGGCNIDLGDYETVLLFAGGSGITFTLGLLDDIVGRCVRKGRKNGERTRRVEFAWCIRSFGQIDWFAKALMDIATVAATSSQSSCPIDLHISVFVTCLCNPEAVPPIPNSDVTIARPSVQRVLMDLITPPRSQMSAVEPSTPRVRLEDSESEEHHQSITTQSDSDISELGIDDVEAPSISPKLPWLGEGGGVAVCASGPVSLTTEAANVVARLHVSGRAARIGGVGLHTEVFAL